MPADARPRARDTGQPEPSNGDDSETPSETLSDTPSEEMEGSVDGLAADVSAAPEEDAGQPVAAEAEADAKPAPRRQRSQGSARAPRGRSAGATAVAEAPPVEEGPPAPRLLEMYRKEIVPALMREFGYTNPMRAPRVQKIVLNIGVGEALTNNRAMEGATTDLTIISGQKPIITRARKSIAGFKLREGNPIGTSVTLRGTRMYHFLDRLINMALPRIRDFRGIQRTGFDGRGNFSIGIREQIIFPEIDYNQIDRIRGLQVTIATSSNNDEEAIRLLELYGMPFVRQT